MSILTQFQTQILEASYVLVCIKVWCVIIVLLAFRPNRANWELCIVHEIYEEREWYSSGVGMAVEVMSGWLQSLSAVCIKWLCYCRQSRWLSAGDIGTDVQTAVCS